jgi:hypothetical protein
VSAAVGFVALVLSISAFVTDRRGVDTAAIFHESFGPLVAVSVLLVLLRKHALSTILNRRANLLLMIIISGITIHRGLALVVGTAAPDVLVGDCLIIALMCAFGAVTIFQWLVVPTAIGLACAAWAATRPHNAMRAFSAGTGLVMLSGAVFTALKKK